MVMGMGELLKQTDWVAGAGCVVIDGEVGQSGTVLVISLPF